jgi:hypothetical protein
MLENEQIYIFIVLFAMRECPSFSTLSGLRKEQRIPRHASLDEG